MVLQKNCVCENVETTEPTDRPPRSLGHTGMVPHPPPLLSGEARAAYYTLSLEEAADYMKVKGEILARCDPTPNQVAAEFHQWSY